MIRRFFHFLLGTGREITGTVYGTIVAMSVVSAGSGHSDVDPWRLAGLVISTAIVFWLAHVYAHALSMSVKSRTRLSVGRLAELARRESAMPLAAFAPALALVLGAVGVLRESRAVWLALGFGVATLGLEGARYARIERLSRPGTLLSIGANLTLGLAIVGLKAGLGH